VPAAPAAPPPPPPSPPVPEAATDVYTGTFSGEAYSEGAFTRWTLSGTAVLDAAQDRGPTFPPPNGAPPGSYRTFTATTGSVDLTVEADPPGDCALDGSGRIELSPGFLNQIVVQLDVPNPAYMIHIAGLPSDVVQVTRSGGAGCSGTSPFPVFTEWASTGTFAHTSPSFALVDSQAELTPVADLRRPARQHLLQQVVGDGPLAAGELGHEAVGGSVAGERRRQAQARGPALRALVEACQVVALGAHAGGRHQFARLLGGEVQVGGADLDELAGEPQAMQPELGVVPAGQDDA
jgi:hypothetical protein